jgi:hypothetical protein
VLGVPDGYLVSLAMTHGPVNETPSFDEGKRKFTSGYFVLRGSRDWCDLVCVSPVCGGGYARMARIDRLHGRQRRHSLFG